MPLRLIRRHSRLLALLAALSALFAASYMIPVNPDSAVFRSGTLGTLLILACAFPAEQALRRHSPRQLAFGTAFALLFTAALSLGSELHVYERLLPGMGSLLRRAAVPVMAAPLWGALFSWFFAMDIRLPAARRRAPWALFFAVFCACYGAVLLAYYPGIINYDFPSEYHQFITGVYEAKHPVFHTVFSGAVNLLGQAVFGTQTAGAALYSAVQILLLAAMYAAAMCFVQRRVPGPVTLALTALTALLPFHGIIAISTVKDALFTGLCLMLCLLLWRAAEDPDAVIASRRHLAALAAVCLLMALLRHNGLFAFLPALAVLPALCRGRRRRAAVFAAACALVCLLVPRGLETAVGAQKTPSSELMSIPCQQLLRTAARADIPEDERTEIGAWFSQAMHRYNPHCADAAKGGNFDFPRYQANPGEYWSMYLHYAKAQPRVYIEAFLENCAALWNPDGTSHTEALAGEQYDHVYLITDYFYEESRFDLHPASKLPKLKALIFDSTHHADHQETLLLAQLFCPATYSFLLLLTTLLLFFRKEKRLALCLLPLWGIFVSLLFCAGIFIRYAYPLMTVVPLMFVLAYFGRRNA